MKNHFVLLSYYKLSETENDCISETYNDSIDIEDDVLYDDIKANRQYIIIYKRKLEDYKSQLLNEIVNLKGYKKDDLVIESKARDDEYKSFNDISQNSSEKHNYQTKSLNKPIQIISASIPTI